MRWPPEITVAAIVPRNQDFLMVEELSQGQTVINQPAGHLEPDESLADAVIREVLEETAYLTRPEAIIGLYQYESEAADTLYFRICFLCRVVEKTSRPLDPDIQAAIWLSAEEIKEKPQRSPLVERCLLDYLAGQRFPLSLYQEIIV